jgi:pimeloyl-ACP methyl ester carboxylesterase
MQTPYKSLVARAPDGVSIAVQDWGNPAGPEILFIHGFSQASLSWARQTSSELTKEFHIVTYDLRGHGNSDKPLEPEKYKESKRWADEVNAVMETAKLKRPVLVGWSYGGGVIADYLRVRGVGGLAGLNFVDTVINSDPSYFGDGLKVQPLMFSEDLATNIAATRQFLPCFEQQPSRDDFETMLAFNMMVPPEGARQHGGAQAEHRRHSRCTRASGAGDAWRGGPYRPADRCEVYGCKSFRRQAFAVRRHRSCAVLGGYGALQCRTRRLRAGSQQDQLTHA